MTRQYFHDLFGVWDPDIPGNATIEELTAHVEALQAAVDAGTAGRAELDRWLDHLAERLRTNSRGTDMVIVPSDQLFIEALPGTHPVLEPFKLLHRKIDVAKAAGELRSINLEALRRAARLVHGDREDPDVDRRIEVHGTSNVEVDPE